MLGKLFGSNSRVKILKLFLLHPENKYYIRQIARDLDLQVNSVRRELENLEKFGLLLSNTAKNENDNSKTQSKPAPEHLLPALEAAGVVPVRNEDNVIELPEEKEKGTLAGKQDKKYYQANKKFVLYEEIKALIIKAQILYEKDFIEKILKIGKIKLLVLSGVFVNNSKSPVDLLVVGKLGKDKLNVLIKEMEVELGRELNFTLMEPEEFTYRRDMTDVFLYDVLEGKKMVIVDEIGLG